MTHGSSSSTSTSFVGRQRSSLLFSGRSSARTGTFVGIAQLWLRATSGMQGSGDFSTLLVGNPWFLRRQRHTSLLSRCCSSAAAGLRQRRRAPLLSCCSLVAAGDPELSTTSMPPSLRTFTLVCRCALADVAPAEPTSPVVAPSSDAAIATTFEALGVEYSTFDVTVLRRLGPVIRSSKHCTPPANSISVATDGSEAFGVGGAGAVVYDPSARRFYCGAVKVTAGPGTLSSYRTEVRHCALARLRHPLDAS